MQLYLNHILTQASLNRLSTETEFSFSQSALDQALQQDLSLPGQLAFLLQPGFIRQELIPSKSLKEVTAQLLHAQPNGQTMTMFLNAIHQKLITYPSDPSNLPDDPTQKRCCFTIPLSVKHYILHHGGAKAIQSLFDNYTPAYTSVPNDQIILQQDENDPTSHLNVTIPTLTFNRLVQIASHFNIVSARSRNDTGQAAAAIEALIRGFI